MPRTREQNKLIKEKRLDLILTAALKCFLRFSYNETNIDNICEEAKISHGLFYHYFKNKEEVYKTLIKVKVIPLMDEIYSSINLNGQKAKYSLIDLLDTLVETIKKDDDIFFSFFLFINMNIEKKTLPKECIKMVKTLYVVIYDLIKKGVEEGDFYINDEKSSTYTILFFILSVCLNRYHLNNKKYLAINSKSIVEIFLKQ